MKPIRVEELERLRYMAYDNQSKGNYFVAEQFYQVLWNLETLAFGPESAGAAICLYRLGELKILQNQVQEGKELFQQAVASWEKNHPSDYVSLLCYTDAIAKVSTAHLYQPFELRVVPRRAA